MLLLVELLFICLLIFLFVMLYKNELVSAKARLSHAVIEECWDGKNRRKYTRFKEALDVIYALEKKAHFKDTARIVDISEGGAKLLLDKKLAKDDILHLKLELPHTNETAEIEGRVIWSEDEKGENESGKRLFHVGIMFSGEPPNRSLIGYIRSLSDKFRF